MSDEGRRADVDLHKQPGAEGSGWDLRRGHFGPLGRGVLPQGRGAGEAEEGGASDPSDPSPWLGSWTGGSWT